MLYSINNGKYVKSTPHQKEFTAWMKKLSSPDYQAIVNDLNGRVNGSDIHTSSWMPGNNWTGTVFQPIYHACNNNVNSAAQFFGLILFDLMIKRDDVWGFGRYEKDGKDIRGITYFLLTNPPVGAGGRP